MVLFKTNLKSSTSLIDLTPLVDVIFLLLVFFIITSDILPLKSLNVENPPLNRSSTPLTSQLLLIVDAQNVIYLGPKKNIVSLTQLKDALLEEMALLRQQQPSADPSIVLSVDRRVEYGAFLHVFSVAQECGSKVRLVYRSAEQGERV